MKKLLVAAIAGLTLAPAAAMAAQGYATVAEVQSLGGLHEDMYIAGAYEGFNAAQILAKQPTCFAPAGTSWHGISTMVQDQWRAYPEKYKGRPAAAGVIQAICDIWAHSPQP